MKEEKNHIKYSAEDIRQYLDGELTDPEMQVLEKAALEDPFLADAIEGFEESRKQSVSFESGVADLKKRLALRIRDKDRKTGIVLLLPKWKIAAAVLFILGVTISTYKYLVNRPTAELAKTTEKDSSKDKPSPSSTIKDSDTMGTLSIQSSPPNTGSNTVGNAKNQADELEKAGDGKKGLTLKRKKTAVDYSSITIKPTVIKETKDTSDKKEEPVAVADEIAKNDALLTPVPKPAAVKLNEKVSGMAIEKDKAATSSQTESTQKQQPVIGWDTFINYINTNKKISTADSVLKGEEIISFLVHPDGKLSSFKVEKSISSAQDAEILRLIKAGPALKIPVGKKQRCRVTITFK